MRDVRNLSGLALKGHGVNRALALCRVTIPAVQGGNLSAATF